jgi:hypothetical protein
MLLWLADKLSEILLPKLLERGSAVVRRNPRRSLLIGSMALGALALREKATQIGLLALYLPFSASQPVAPQDLPLFRSLQARLEDGLLVSAEQIAANDSQEDVWGYADILAGVRPEVIESKLHIDHLGLFRKHMEPDSYCWAQFHQSRVPLIPCHHAATAWVLLAMTANAIRPDQKMWEYLLHEQDDEGWWPLYQQAGNDKRNASTYATALSLHAIHSGLRSNLVPEALVPRLKQRAARARSWLLAKRHESCSWPDYPHRDVDRNYLPSISNLVVFVLLSQRPHELNEIQASCLQSILQSQPSIAETETSGVLIRLNNGDTLNDAVRHQKLIMASLALSALYDQASILDKARVRLHLRDTLFAGGATPEQNLDYPWQLGEFAFLVRQLLGGS